MSVLVPCFVFSSSVKIAVSNVVISCQFNSMDDNKQIDKWPAQCRRNIITNKGYVTI